MNLELSRRQVLQASGIFFGGASLPGLSLAQDLTRHSTHSFKIGEIEITVLSDGKMSLPQSLVLPDIPGEKVESLFASIAGGRPAFDMDINAAIVRTGDHTILVDSGGGTDFLPGMGRIPDLLSDTGLEPSSITDVIFTHAHPDHFWGVIDPFDEVSRFTNARHFMTAAEVDFWLKPDRKRAANRICRSVT